MKTLVFGGDGFCGWPTALHLSNAGHDIVIVDKQLGMGLEPITLNKGLMLEEHDIVTKYKQRCDRSKVTATSLCYLKR